MFSRSAYVAAPFTALAVLVGCEQKPIDLNRISTNFSVFTDKAQSLEKHMLVEVKIGDLELTDGKLVALDPLSNSDRPAFNRTVAPGTYPVSYIHVDTPVPRRAIAPTICRPSTSARAGAVPTIAWAWMSVCSALAGRTCRPI